MRTYTLFALFGNNITLHTLLFCKQSPNWFINSRRTHRNRRKTLAVSSDNTPKTWLRCIINTHFCNHHFEARWPDDVVLVVTGKNVRKKIGFRKSFMHFELNWIFIDGIYFKRIENWLHNGSRKTQKHDVNLTLNECHRTIRYQKKGNELWRVFVAAAVGAGSLFSSFKRNVISFFRTSQFSFCGKRERDEKMLNLILRRNPHTWNTITSDSLLNSLTHTQSNHSRLIYSMLIVALPKTKIYSVTQSYRSHAEFGCKNR